MLKPLKGLIERRQQEAAAFGRLCVETKGTEIIGFMNRAAAFGRLCVETEEELAQKTPVLRSRLRAAVC